MTTSESRPARSTLVSGYPFVGALPLFLVRRGEFLLRVAKAHAGEVVTLQLGPRRAYLLTHPRQFEHVLRVNWRSYSKGTSFWRTVKRLTGNGIVASEGETWLRSRQLMQPLFAQARIDQLTGTLAQLLREAMSMFESHASSGAPVDMDREARRLTLHVVLGIIFGADLAPDEMRALLQTMGDALAIANRRMPLDLLPEWLPLPGDRAFSRSLRAIDALVVELIERERTRTGGERDSLLSILLHASEAGGSRWIGNEQIRNELVTMVFAGTETSSATMAWLWYLLAAHPEAQRRAREEADHVLGPRSPGKEDVGRLSYCGRLVQETMRLFPPPWLLPRVAQNEDCIDGVTIPPGSPVLLSSYVLHRNPAYWERPDVFDPDRFLPDRLSAPEQQAYLPFGAGPRGCISGNLALMEMRLVAAMTAQRYRLRLARASAGEPSFGLTLRPRGGLPIVIERV